MFAQRAYKRYTQIMRKTYKYRLFPTSAQRTALLRALDACRWVYNQALEMRKTAWDERRESLSRYDTIRLLPGWKAEQPWLNAAYSQSLQGAARSQPRLPAYGEPAHRLCASGKPEAGQPLWSDRL